MQLEKFFYDSARIRAIDEKSHIYHLHYYNSYWLDGAKTKKNPRFDSYSSRILDLKNNRDYGINYYNKVLSSIIKGGINICCVPSHDPENKITGVNSLIAKLCFYSNYFNATSYLIRTKKIAASHSGGLRSIEQHLKTIEINPKIDYSLEGKDVLLLDDVFTTGSSLIACREILMKKGYVGTIVCLAIGKTSGRFYW